MNIETETLTDELFTEILPLAQKCWNESTELKAESCAYYGERDFAIEPNREEYKKLADMNALVVVTLRDEGQLRGYVVGFAYRSLHHKSILCAVGDSIYVEPDYRSNAGVLIDRFLDELTKRGAQIIGWPTTIDGYVYRFLVAKGFVGDDIVMEKRLCA